MKLSILILSVPNRMDMLYSLTAFIREQMYQLRQEEYEDYEILIDDSPDDIGTKRNRLLQSVRGKYFAFIDDDDMITDFYFTEFLKGYELEPDCFSLRGIITFNGQNAEVFEHSIKYSEWTTTDNAIKYERPPNHLNFIKSEIGKQFTFPQINHGEDRDWSMQIQKSGLLKKEYYIDKIIYNYLYITNK